MKSLYFPDYPEFRPNLTPKQIFDLGSFGGTYWRPIYSHITGKHHKNIHKKYKFLHNIPEEKLSKEWKKYDVNTNKYKVKVGTTLRFWEQSGWIKPSHPYGWVHWYCDFYSGKRCSDDARQIKRWLRIIDRFAKRLVHMMPKYDNTTSPKIRQTLQHWGYVLTPEEYKKLK